MADLGRPNDLPRPPARRSFRDWGEESARSRQDVVEMRMALDEARRDVTARRDDPLARRGRERRGDLGDVSVAAPHISAACGCERAVVDDATRDQDFLCSFFHDAARIVMW